MPADIIAFCGCRAAGYQGVILAEWFVYQTSDAYDTVIGYRSFVEHKYFLSKPVVVSDFYSFFGIKLFLVFISKTRWCDIAWHCIFPANRLLLPITIGISSSAPGIIKKFPLKQLLFPIITVPCDSFPGGL